MALKPWREVITPHKNVLEGTFQQSEYAADMTKVVAGNASAEYQDPALFFERTYITEGMRLLLDSVVKRLAGKGGDPVVRLQTAFGGGKTHTMLAVYHLARQEKSISEMLGIPSILDSAGITNLPNASVAVLDGNALSPSHPRPHGSIIINTAWGEIAWQLGGEEGYRMVEQADCEGTSPGKEILAALFTRFAPCVVLLDETIAYIRQFESGKSYAGGTFESNMSFIQALTEAAASVPSAMVFASLIESDRETGGQRGIEALTHLEIIFQRKQALWKPVATEESFEIVRRRLFAPLHDENARDAVCQAFMEIYQKNDKYPSQSRESRYKDRLQTAYPFHPELFDRLYEDWSTLENFQRTRGVLRLMAMVVHNLWVDGNKDYLILPGSVPLDKANVRNELISYLPQGWDPVLERDVDGVKALTTAIDSKNPALGELQASRRVARTILLGSAPSSVKQNVRGLNVENIRLGCVQPGQSPGRYEDALSHLINQLHYLYSVNNRYWYDTQTNLRREAEDRMNRFNKNEDMLAEIRKRLQILLKGGIFAGIHVFTPHADIPDDDSLRLVVLPPTHSHIGKVKEKPTMAITLASDYIAWRGQKPRVNKNRLVFFAADNNTVTTLYDNTKKYLAWQSIINEKELLNLDPLRLREAESNRRDSNSRLDASITETFKWLLSPLEEMGKKNQFDTRWEENRVAKTGDVWMPSIEKVLKESEIVITEWAPVHLRNLLEKWFWKDTQQEYPLLKLWNDCCQYLYLPRLSTSQVLRETVKDGVKSTEFFGYSQCKENDHYADLLFGQTGNIYWHEDSLLLSSALAADLIQQAQSAEGSEELDDTPTTDAGNTTAGSSVTGKPSSGKVIPGSLFDDNLNNPPKGQTPKPLTFTRYYGSATLKPSSAGLDFSKICEEVIQHFTSKLGTKVTIDVEIRVDSPAAFDENLIRTVKENAKTLGFVQSEFEEE